jgi:hypothetical protein
MCLWYRLRSGSFRDPQVCIVGGTILKIKKKKEKPSVATRS